MASDVRVGADVPSRRVLVTGGAGFIGSNVARLLCDSGYEVTVLDNLSFGHRSLVDTRCRFVQADVGDLDTLRHVLGEVDAVMHFAASSIISRSYLDPVAYIQNNVLNGVTLLEAMRLANLRRLVFSSSASVYGEPRRVPIHEDDPKNPLQVYGASKLAFESLLEGYARAFGFNAVSLRYFNAYGPGDLQEPTTRAVPRWIRAALTGQPIVVYWGGRQLRDYVYVEDIARAHLQVLDLTGVHTYNLGTGSGVLMRDVLGKLEELIDRPLVVSDGGERNGDPMRLVADISRIKSEVGWRPIVELAEGLRRTIDFYESHRSYWFPGD